jgi:hypothetical protein
MNKPETNGENTGRFFKKSRDGRWHRKTGGGGYKPVRLDKVLRRLWIASAECSRRHE